MNPSGLRPCIAVLALVLAACGPDSDPPDRGADNLRARLDQTWPPPAPAGNAAEQFWRFENGRLTLWEPDPAAPPPVPGRVLLSLRCEGDRLSVETGIMVASDVPLPAPPFDTLTIQGGGERIATRIDPVGDGFSSWAAGSFPIDRARLRRILEAPHLVIRPLHVGDPQTSYAGVDFGERYAPPPAGLREAFLGQCPLAPGMGPSPAPR